VTHLRLKRAFDVALTVPALLLSAPVQLAVAVAVWRKLGRPVLFRQMRPGLHGTSFQLVKFRTMRPVDPSQGWIDDASRLTPFGSWLRSTSLDELPTLWNVVRGDMSLVGPRPLLVQYLDRYTPQQARRHDVPPGLTGLAQVTGRNGLTWEEKLRLDIEYVDSRTFAMDLRIILKSVVATLARRNIAASDHATMPEFMGNAMDHPQ